MNKLATTTLFLIIFSLSAQAMGKPDSYKVAVDYDLRLDQAIKAGKYGCVDNRITQKKFPATQKGKATVEILLVDMSRDATTDQVLTELEKRGLRAATLPELLALGATHPNLQLQFYIAALGSTWQYPDGDLAIPTLGKQASPFPSCSGRSLGQNKDGGGWNTHTRFTAVRK